MSGQQSYMPSERDKRGKKRRNTAKPFEVWYRAKRGTWFREWCRFGRYRDLAVAEKVVSQKSNDSFFEYEVRGTT